MKLDGNKLMRLRVKADLTQVQLAEKAGLTNVTVSNAEGSKPIQALSAQRLATALGVELEDLEVPDFPVPITAAGEAELVREVKESAKESA